MTNEQLLELELLNDIPVLQNELDWIIEVIDELQSKESVSGVIGEFSSKNNSTKWTRFHMILDSNLMDKLLERFRYSHVDIFS